MTGRTMGRICGVVFIIFVAFVINCIRGCWSEVYAGSFGNEEDGAFNNDVNGIYALVAASYTFTADADYDVDSIGFRGYTTSDSAHVSVAIYQGSDSALVDSAIVDVLNGEAAWLMVGCNMSMVNGETYFLAIGNERAGAVQLMWSAEDGAGKRDVGESTLPDPWASDADLGWRGCLRAVYSAAAGGAVKRFGVRK